MARGSNVTLCSFCGRKGLRGHPGSEKGRQAVFHEARSEHAPGLQPPMGLIAGGFERGMKRRNGVRFCVHVRYGFRSPIPDVKNTS